MPTMLTALAVLDSTAASLGDINIPKAECHSGRALAPFVSQFQSHGGRLALGTCSCLSVWCSGFAVALKLEHGKG